MPLAPLYTAFPRTSVPHVPKFCAATADRIIFSARTSGGQSDRDGITLFAVAGDAEGLSREDYPTVDGLRASEVTLKDVKVTPDGIIGEVGGACRSSSAWSRKRSWPRTR